VEVLLGVTQLVAFHSGPTGDDESPGGQLFSMSDEEDAVSIIFVSYSNAYDLRTVRK
jgi:hypothetical protein